MNENVAPPMLPPAGTLTPDKGNVDISFFVACYNEAENIVGTLNTLRDTMAETDLSWEAVVIDDGSTDDSLALVQNYIRENPNVPVYCKANEVNQGLGYSYTDGAFLARGKYYRLVCGDNVETKENLLKLLKHLGEADMIVPYYKIIGRSWGRTVLSKTFTRLVNAITGHHLRYYNGLAIHLRYNVMRWHGYSRGFGFQADLIARLLDEGCSYQEVSLEIHERKTGKAKAIRWRNFLSVGHTLLDLILRRISRRVYGRRGARPGREARRSARAFDQRVPSPLGKGAANVPSSSGIR